MKTPLSMLALFVALVVSGCGTIATHAGGGDEATQTGAYRGVRYISRHVGDDQGGGIFILDIPLSAVADTLLLPYDLLSDAHE